LLKSEIMVTPREIPAVSVVQALVNELREQILSGRVMQGSILRENELCAAFNVSRHTVRSAVQALAFERLVRHERNRGAYVTQITGEDVREIFQIRALIEVEAVRLVAGNGRSLALARKAIDRLEELPDDAYWGEIRDADLAFHQAVVDEMGSNRMSSVFSGLRTELRLCFLQIREELSQKAIIVRQHRAILQQLERGNVKSAIGLIKSHLDDGRRNISARVMLLAPPGKKLARKLPVPRTRPSQAMPRRSV
jgi:DNA-binding GntR family transcriptional regulator